MNLTEYLLDCMKEECAEIIQRATKASRFGLEEKQPGQELTNRERLFGELNDLIGVIEALRNAGIMDYQVDEKAVEAKLAKLRKYVRYSAEECGTLDLNKPANKK